MAAKPLGEWAPSISDRLGKGNNAKVADVGSVANAPPGTETFIKLSAMNFRVLLEAVAKRSHGYAFGPIIVRWGRHVVSGTRRWAYASQDTKEMKATPAIVIPTVLGEDLPRCASVRISAMPT